MRSGSRGGRGGGRGFGGRGTLSQDLIKDNLEDLGLEIFQTIDDRIPPPLYPTNVTPPSPAPLSENDKYCVKKMREISYRFQASHFYLSRKVEQVDIKRYSDCILKRGHDSTLLDCINTSSTKASLYIPHELLDPIGASTLRSAGVCEGGASRMEVRVGRKRVLRSHILTLLERQEADSGGVQLQPGNSSSIPSSSNGSISISKNRAEGASVPGKGGESDNIVARKEGEESDGEDGAIVEIDDSEMDDDYGVDHYASDDEGGLGDDDGDGEAVF